MARKIERIAELAMGLGQKHLADYGAVRSRHDFTQRQLMSCLILRAYLKTTYRGLVDLLSGHESLRRILGMEEKLPHYTTLQNRNGDDDSQRPFYQPRWTPKTQMGETFHGGGLRQFVSSGVGAGLGAR